MAYRHSLKRARQQVSQVRWKSTSANAAAAARASEPSGEVRGADAAAIRVANRSGEVEQGFELQRRFLVAIKAQISANLRGGYCQASSATVLEVRGPDSIGFLYRVTRAFVELDLDIARAKVHTLGDDVIDTFYVLGPDGAKATDPEYLAEIEIAVLSAIGADA